MIELIAFLGNYGEEYKNTRHNTAWLFESSLPFTDKLLWQSKHKADFCSCYYQDIVSSPPKNYPPKLYFIKPMTYMNLSGEAVGEAARFYKIPAENILIVHDEIELPLGTVSLKWSGGLGGHNGLRSIKASLGTADFWRLRFGVGKPANVNIADYVLGAFSADERIILSQVFSQANVLLDKVLSANNAQHLLTEWGKKKVIPEVK